MAAPSLIEAGFDRLSERDLDGWLEMFTADARLYDLPELPDADAYEGHDGLRRWAQNNFELTEAWEWRLVGVLAEEGDRMVTEVDLSGRGVASDVPVRIEVFHVFRVRDGKIASVHAFATRSQAFEEAGLEDPGD